MTPEITAVLLITATVLTFYGMWKVFEKAGEGGWKAVVPVYNFYILLRISGYSGWYIFMLCLPLLSWLLHESVLPLLLCPPANDIGCGAGWVFQVPDFFTNPNFWTFPSQAILIVLGVLLLYVTIIIIFSVFLCRVLHHLARNFHKSSWFSLGLLLLPFIFWPILGLNAAKYEGVKQDHISMSSNIFKNKYVVLLLVLIILGGAYYFFQAEQKIEIISESENEITFVGRISSGEPNNCTADSACSFMVEDWKVGLERGSHGRLQTKIDDDTEIGNLVKVKAKKIGQKTVSLNGSAGYFVKNVAKTHDIGGQPIYLPKGTLTQDNSEESNQRRGGDIGGEKNTSENNLYDFSREEYQELTSLEKAKLSIEANTQFDELSKTFSITSHESKYSVYHSLGESLAAVEEASTSSSDNNVWNLYKIDKSGKESLLYSGLIEDCCGGGIPTIKEGPVSFVPVVIAKSGDACFSKLGKTYVNLRDAPKDYLHVGRSNSCESISSLSIETGEEAFKFEPMLSQDCKAADPGTAVTFSGLKASSSDNTYTKKFSDPIRMTCTEGIGDTGDALYSKTISYREPETGIRLNEVDFRIRVYDLNTKESESIPSTFSPKEGFIEQE